ncbi:MAG: hypothetical protein HQ551_03710 [Desulfobacteraceae bacterium]|nr:hypothetical protein [Desulfobacteraceae bacterium]
MVLLIFDCNRDLLFALSAKGAKTLKEPEAMAASAVTVLSGAIHPVPLANGCE